MKFSKEYKAVEKEWLGQKIKFYLQDVLDRKSDGHKLIGPFFGTVKGISNNEAMIEDGLEGCTHKDLINFTGFLIVESDDFYTEQFVSYIHAEKIEVL